MVTGPTETRLMKETGISHGHIAMTAWKMLAISFLGQQTSGSQSRSFQTIYWGARWLPLPLVHKEAGQLIRRARRDFGRGRLNGGESGLPAGLCSRPKHIWEIECVQMEGRRRTTLASSER